MSVKRCVWQLSSGRFQSWQDPVVKIKQHALDSQVQRTRLKTGYALRNTEAELAGTPKPVYTCHCPGTPKPVCNAIILIPPNLCVHACHHPDTPKPVCTRHYPDTPKSECTHPHPGTPNLCIHAIILIPPNLSVHAIILVPQTWVYMPSSWYPRPVCTHHRPLPN